MVRITRQGQEGPTATVTPNGDLMRVKSNVAGFDFAELLDDGMLTDVTIAVEGEIIKAHKCVLSVCSSYFKEMFQVNRSSHPTIVFKDIRYRDFSNLMDYMYRGEANVKLDEFASFKSLGEHFKVRGLYGNQTRESNGPTPSTARQVPAPMLHQKRQMAAPSRQPVQVPQRGALISPAKLVPSTPRPAAQMASPSEKKTPILQCPKGVTMTRVASSPARSEVSSKSATIKIEPETVDLASDVKPLNGQFSASVAASSPPQKAQQTDVLLNRAKVSSNGTRPPSSQQKSGNKPKSMKPALTSAQLEKAIPSASVSQMEPPSKIASKGNKSSMSAKTTQIQKRAPKATSPALPSRSETPTDGQTFKTLQVALTPVSSSTLKEQQKNQLSSDEDKVSESPRKALLRQASAKKAKLLETEESGSDGSDEVEEPFENEEGDEDTDFQPPEESVTRREKQGRVIKRKTNGNAKGKRKMKKAEDVDEGQASPKKRKRVSVHTSKSTSSKQEPMHAEPAEKMVTSDDELDDNMPLQNLFDSVNVEKFLGFSEDDYDGIVKDL